jgi:hypothetical protein
MAKKARKHGSKKRSGSRKRNAARVANSRPPRRRSVRPRRTNGSRRFVGHRGRQRTFHVGKQYNRQFHVRGTRARRINGRDTLMGAAIAVGVGVAASVAASYLLDTLSTSVTSLQSSTAQDGVLLVGAAGAAFYIKNPAIAAGVATGLLLIPLAKLIYSTFPSLASANSYNPQNPSVTMTSLHRPMGSLHGAMGSLHAPMGALFDVGGDDDSDGMGTMGRQFARAY